VRWEKLRFDKFECEAAIAHSPLANITIAACRDGRLKQVAPATVAREMNLLRSVLEVARKEWQWLKTHPITQASRSRRLYAVGLGGVSDHGRRSDFSPIASTELFGERILSDGFEIQ